MTGTLDLFEIHRPEFLEEARQVAKDLASGGNLVTVDDVRVHCPPPDNVDPRVMGAVFNSKEWEPVNYIRSTRSTCHKRPICQFRYVGA